MLKPIREIHVPSIKMEQTYEFRKYGKNFSFLGLKKLLAAADMSKAGDRNAGLAAKIESEREAARHVLANLTLEHLFENPLTTKGNQIDEVMRVNYDIDQKEYEKIKNLTVGQYKNFLLSARDAEVAASGLGLTGVMAAAVAKICDTHELIFIAKKIHRPTKARTTLGLTGTLSSRLQPNHPVDDLRGIEFLSYLGLSLASGDALFGVNPAIDTVESVTAVLEKLKEVREKTGAPSQICVLSHIKTQMAALEKGAPVEIMFQSLAGTESTLLTEFDVNVELLDRAYTLMKEKGPLKDIAKQFMYFETGQGSEFTYAKHESIDMTTLEACCYGLARRYDPFMMNNVTGFIGPETHLDNFEMIYSCLQDHFMGKLLGVPMGMAPCYTLHANITLEGQQMATQMLTAAGANYYMDVGFNTDRMLAYFDTSAHDDQTLREIYNKNLTPEFQTWALSKEIVALNSDGTLTRGKNWARPEMFCTDPEEFNELKKWTPALFNLDTAGPRPVDEATREMKFHQAVSRDAIYSEIDLSLLEKAKPFTVVATKAKSKLEHLNSPTLGSFFSEESLRKMTANHPQVQILISDGLSAEAIHKNIPTLIPILRDAFTARKIKFSDPIVAPYGRVKLAEEIAIQTKSEVTLLLIGERPGGDAQASTSMSAYLLYYLQHADVKSDAIKFSGNENIKFEYSVISNIYPQGGLPPLEAASVIVEKILQILEHRAAGNRLEARLKSLS